MSACLSDYKINVCIFSDIVVDEAHNVLFSFPEDSLSPALKVATQNKTEFFLNGIGVRWIEFGKFRESNKSLKYELKPI